MKKVLVLCVCLIGFLSADWKRVMGSSDTALPPEKEVMKSDTLGVFIRTAVFGFNEQDTTVDNKDFKRIEIPEELIDWDTTNAGKPQIPYIRLLIAVPDSCEFDITVYESDYTLFEDYLIYPIPRIVFEETSGCFCSKEVYTYDATFYGKDTLYPDKFYEVNSDGHWRDQRVLEVFLYPVQFNPGQELMYFYTNFNLRLEYSGEVVENENGLGPFEDIGREILLNYPGIDKEPESVPEPAVHYYTDLLDTNNVADYIIVTHQDFLGDEIDSLKIHEFAEWRVSHNQFDVGIVKMQDIYPQFPGTTPDSAAQLRDFLVYAYENWHANSMSDGHFAYCLFIGDWDYVPTRLYTYFYGIEEWLGAEEGYFKELTSDFYEDIMLGRWPVKFEDPSAQVPDLMTIAQKTINYEKHPVQVDSFRRRSLLIAGGGCYANNFDGLVTFSIPYFTDINYDTLTVRWLDINNEVAFRESIDNYLNHGEIITVYHDHGAPEGWWVHYDTQWVKDLENADRLPVVLSHACFTAMFQWDNPFYDLHHSYPAGISLGEHFLINPNGGAVAFYGCTVFAYLSHSYAGLEILKRILCYQYWTLGKTLVNLHATHGGLGYEAFCLLGDPALDLGDYTAFPDLPDLVVRPQGTDISLLSPYPYPAGGDEIPIRAKVYNIGGATAYNIDVKFEVVYAPNQTYTDIVIIEEIGPLDTAVATVYWNTALTHPDYYGEIGDCEFIVTADPDSEITESWEYNNASSATKQVVLYSGWSKKIPSPLGIDENVPAIANLDGTGAVEIVCPGLDSLYVFDPEGNLVSGWPKYFPGVYGVVLGDIDNNGYIDVVAVSPESIKVYDYQGNMLNGWPVQIELEDYQFTGLPALGRIESGVSNVFNVVVVAKTRSEENLMPMKIFVYNRQGLRVYTFDSDIDVTSTCLFYGPSIGNVVSGGNDEIIISYLDKRAHQPPTTEIFNYNGLIDSLNYGGPVISALVDLDIPADGYAEVITGGSDKKIRAYKATTGQTLWERETGGAINSSPAVGDIHPGLIYPGVEITFGNYASRVHLRWELMAILLNFGHIQSLQAHTLKLHRQLPISMLTMILIL